MWCPYLAQATPGKLGKWVDRDCNAALNLQRAGESKWRPLELCRWQHRGRLPAQGREYPALGFKKLRERAPKAQAQQPVVHTGGLPEASTAELTQYMSLLSDDEQADVLSKFVAAGFVGAKQKMVPRLSSQELECIGIQPKLVRSALLQAFADGGRDKTILLVDSEGTEKQLRFRRKQEFDRWLHHNTLVELLPNGLEQVVAVWEHLEDGGRYLTNTTFDKRVSGVCVQIACNVLPMAPRKPPQAPRSSQEALQPAASEPGPSTPLPAKCSKRTKAEPAAEPNKAQGKAVKAKPAPQPGRWLDRDCNAALNMQRIGGSRWWPLELCWWPEQGKLPAKAKEYPGLGYKRQKRFRQTACMPRASTSGLPEASTAELTQYMSLLSDDEQADVLSKFVAAGYVGAKLKMVPRLSNQELECIGIQPQLVRSALLQEFADGGPGKTILLVDSEGTEEQLEFSDKQDFNRWLQSNTLMLVLQNGTKRVVATWERLEDGGRPRGTDQLRGRVVLVDEHRTSRVSSAVNAQQPCERQLNKRRATRPADWKPPAGQAHHRLVRPAWSQQRDQPVWGMMWCPVVAPRKPPQAPRSSQEALQPAASEPGPSTPLPAKCSKRTKAEPAAEPNKAQGKAVKAKPAPQPGRWLDRDCNAALNMQRIGGSRWWPLELCWWPEQGKLPAKGKEYPGLGYKRQKRFRQTACMPRASTSGLPEASTAELTQYMSLLSDDEQADVLSKFVAAGYVGAKLKMVPRLSNQELECIGIQPQLVRSALLQEFADGGPGKTILLVDSEGTKEQLEFSDKQDFNRWLQSNTLMLVLQNGTKRVVATWERLEDGGRPRGTDQLRGRVVLVDEHRTSQVSSAVNGQQPCERQPNKRRATRPADWKPPAGQAHHRLVRPAWSQQRDQPVWGMMWCPVVAPRKPPQAPRSSQEALQPAASEPGPSTPLPAKRSKRIMAEPAAEPTQPTKDKGKAMGKAAKAKPAPQPGRWLDRDCNAALNMQRIGESRWRPLELCWWPEQGKLPAKAKEYPGLGYKRVRDKPPKAQPAVAQNRRYPDIPELYTLPP
ncbi:hypothetical protein QJQ45_026256 [Haematococcus lacustris]|nr:hypothetical protein QJQ45_026256 [Haematococcus lacustris]